MQSLTKRMLGLAVVATITLATAARQAGGTTIAEYTFDGASAVSTDTAANSTAADFVKNPVSSDWGFSGGGNVFARSNATTASELAAVGAGDYFGFTVTPDAPFEFDLTALNFETFHNATFGGGGEDAGATMSFFLRSSADGFAANIGSTFTQGWNTGPITRSIDLTGAAFQDLQTATEFRFYIHDSGVDTAINGARMDNVTLEGAVLTDGTTGFQEGVSPTGAYTHDAVTIRSAAANQNSSDQLIVGVTAGNELLRTLLEFDVSDIPSTDQIDSTSLVMTVDSGLDDIGANSAQFNVFSYGFDIDETVSTWDDPDGDGNNGTGDIIPGGSEGTLLSSATFDPTASDLVVTFADSSAFRTAVADALAGDGILRLILAKNDETTSSEHEFTRFFAESASGPEDRPRLLVSHSAAEATVPEPSTATLALVGLMGLGWLRRNRDYS